MNLAEFKEHVSQLDVSGLEKLKIQAEVEKLNIEITNLKDKTKPREKTLQYIPLLTVLIAVAGFLSGIFQFTNQQSEQHKKQIEEQQKDLSIRIQNQIRSDLDELLHFTNNEHQTVSRMLFLLEDLKYLLILSSSAGKAAPDILPHQERVITQSLVGLIDNDCDFTRKERDVHFTATVIDHWEDYSEYLKANPDILDESLSKYEIALEALHNRDPMYFQSMQYSPSEGFSWGYSSSESKYDQYRKFIGLKYGFQMHLDLLEQNNDLKDIHIRAFQEALCNSRLTKQLFGKDFPDMPDCVK